ncbi:hypothetical protein TNCV_5122571 [Trichonephila clavipes]|nr:hypothetical protein TNCV_5122571 [Trichonephila clavipes]
MTPELASPLLTTTPHQREDVSALDRINVHHYPTRQLFSGAGLELVASIYFTPLKSCIAALSWWESVPEWNVWGTSKVYSPSRDSRREVLWCLTVLDLMKLQIFALSPFKITRLFENYEHTSSSVTQDKKERVRSVSTSFQEVNYNLLHFHLAGTN